MNPFYPKGLPKPRAIIFFSNGLTAVCDQYRQQMPQYQEDHQEAIRLLAADGYDWKTLDSLGNPQG